jgi:hypothetical protein
MVSSSGSVKWKHSDGVNAMPWHVKAVPARDAGSMKDTVPDAARRQRPPAARGGCESGRALFDCASGAAVDGMTQSISICRRRGASCSLVIAALSLATSLAAQVVPSITTTFDAGTTEGWTATSAVTVQGNVGGGNPGGSLFVDCGNGQTHVFAPVAYRGDLRSYYGGTLSFDGRMDPTSTGTLSASQYNYGRIALVDQQGYRIYADAVPGVPQTQWTTYSLPLTPAVFGVTQPVLDSYLANCTGILIGLDALTGSERHWLDNIVLSPSATPAAAQPAGGGCPSSQGSNTMVAWTLPWVGATAESRVYGVPYGVTVGLFGLAPLPSIPLSSLFAEGVPGCSVHVTPDVLVSAAPSSLVATFQFAIPNTASLAGAQYWHQAIPVQLALGPVAFTASNAMRMTIGLR